MDAYVEKHGHYPSRKGDGEWSRWDSWLRGKGEKGLRVWIEKAYGVMLKPPDPTLSLGMLEEELSVWYKKQDGHPVTRIRRWGRWNRWLKKNHNINLSEYLIDKGYKSKLKPKSTPKPKPFTLELLNQELMAHYARTGMVPTYSTYEGHHSGLTSREKWKLWSRRYTWLIDHHGIKLQDHVANLFGVDAARLATKNGARTEEQKSAKFNEIVEEIEKYHQEHGTYPKYNTSTEWCNRNHWLRQHYGTTLIKFVKSRYGWSERSLDKLDVEISKHVKEHGTRPTLKGKWVSWNGYLSYNHRTTLKKYIKSHPDFHDLPLNLPKKPKPTPK